MAVPKGPRDGKPSASAPEPSTTPPKSGKAEAMLRAGMHLHAKLQSAATLRSGPVSTDGLLIDVPDFAGLQVRVPLPDPITDKDVDARIAELVRTHTPLHPVKPGQAVKLDDEILVDATGYAAGQIFSAQADTWWIIRPNPLLPGLFEGLVGTVVGANAVIPLTLPADYPDPGYAGSTAAFAVEVRQARRPQQKPDPKRLLVELGLGKTYDAARKELREQLMKDAASRMVDHAKSLVLDALMAKAPGTVPDAMVEATLKDIWREEEGQHLAKAGIPVDEQNEAYRTFALDKERRRLVRRGVWERYFLDKVADEQGIQVASAEVSAMLSQLGTPNAPSQLKAMVEAKKGGLDELALGLRRNRALEHILSIAKVQFG